MKNYCLYDPSSSEIDQTVLEIKKTCVQDTAWSACQKSRNFYDSVNLHPDKFGKKLQQIPAWPLIVCVDIRTLDLNPHQQEYAVEYFVK